MTEDQRGQPQPPKDRKSIHEIRNQDLVSRLLAATPPYLYSAPVGPNNFFFSDMLRSLVQARNNENARNIQLQQTSLGRRPRKRSWGQHRPIFEHLKERKETEEKHSVEKPLELTNKQLYPISSKYAKPTEHKDELSHTSSSERKSVPEFEHNVQTQEQPAPPLPSSDLVLPPPPPVWYPPLYPPYGIDPLHFFIDLRVSGHIYDRKKENASPIINPDNNNISTIDSENIGKHRLGSAFTVPAPRHDSKTASAINLSSSSNSYSKYYDLGDSKENQQNCKNTNYVLQNLPRIYTHLTSRDGSEENGFDQDVEEIEERDPSNHIDVEILDNIRPKLNLSRSQTPIDRGQVHQID